MTPAEKQTSALKSGQKWPQACMAEIIADAYCTNTWHGMDWRRRQSHLSPMFALFSSQFDFYCVVSGASLRCPAPFRAFPGPEAQHSRRKPTRGSAGRLPAVNPARVYLGSGGPRPAKAYRQPVDSRRRTAAGPQEERPDDCRGSPICSGSA